MKKRNINLNSGCGYKKVKYPLYQAFKKRKKKNDDIIHIPR